MKTYMMYALLLVSCLANSACTGLLLGSNGSAGENSVYTTTQSDRVIIAGVQQALSADTALQGASINVNARDGRVILSGQVLSYAQRDRALQSARQVTNVRSVDNRLVVNRNR